MELLPLGDRIYEWNVRRRFSKVAKSYLVDVLMQYICEDGVDVADVVHVLTAYVQLLFVVLL